MHQTFALPLDELPDPLPVPVLARRLGRAPVAVTVRPPGSKSLTNRALLLAAIAPGRSVVRRPLLGADDAERMLCAIRTLGAEIETRAADAVTIRGVGGRWPVGPEGARLDLNNAGTATRFLAAAALLADGPVTIDGNARMRERPIGELGAMLEKLGARVEHELAPGRPPVRITPGTPPQGATLDIEPTLSSQFVSALLLTAPALPGGLTLRLHGTVTSASYIRMTVELLGRVGVTVKTTDDLRIVRVLPGLEAFDLEIEADASGATYFWAAGALAPGTTCRVAGLADPPIQGDAGFPDLLARMGATVVVDETPEHTVACRGPDRLGPIMADMADMPDAAVTLAVCCAFARGTSVLRGVRTLRVKECDRIAALQTELAKIGVTVEDNVHGDPDVMTVTPPDGGVDCSPDAPAVEFDTYDDHRMAMALALVGLRRPGVLIRDPGCVAKTYPGYWQDLAGLYG